MAERFFQLWNSVASTTNNPEVVLALSEILSDRADRDFILSLGREEAKRCINILDRVSFDLHLPHSPPQKVCQGIVEPNLRPAEKHDFFSLLRRLAQRHGRLPDRMMIKEKIEVSDELLTFFDGSVGAGTYKGHSVAVKTARFGSPRDLEKIRKVSINDILVPTRGVIPSTPPQRFCKEVVLWSVLSHPNILEFVGVQVDMVERQLATVSKWMGHGNIMQFARKNHVNRLELVRDFTSSPTLSVEMG